MRKIIAFALFLALGMTAFSQPHDSKHKDRWEKYRSEKIAFLTTNLELTPAEAQRFWPVYNQLEKERWESQMLRREMEEKVLEAEESLPDQEIKELTREFAGSLKYEANMLESYNEKFLEILPPSKVLKLYKYENEFRKHMIKKWRDKKRDND